MPITSDAELDEALSYLEDPTTGPEERKSLMRAVRAYNRGMPSGAPASAMAPVGIDAIEQGQEELRPALGPDLQIPPPEPTPNRAMAQGIPAVAPDPYAPQQVAPGSRSVRPAQKRMPQTDPVMSMVSFAAGVPGGLIPGATGAIERGMEYLVPGGGDAMREFREGHPGFDQAGSLLGAVTPFGVESTIARGIGMGIPRALPRAAAAAPTTVRAVSAGLGAGTAAAAGGAMRDAGDQFSQGGVDNIESPNLVAAAERFGTGAALGAGLDVVGAAAGSLAKRNRSTAPFAPEVNRFERGGGRIGVTGLKPGPAMKANQAEVDALAAEGRVVTPADVALSKVEEPIARAALREQTNVVKRATDETAAYNAATEGTALETEPLLKSSIDELRKRSFSTGGPLPAGRPSTQKVRDVADRLMEAEIVPASQADEMAKAGALVFDADELEGLGLTPKMLTKTARVVPDREVFARTHKDAPALREFIGVTRGKGVREALASGETTEAGRTYAGAKRYLDEADAAGLTRQTTSFSGRRMSPEEIQRTIDTGDLDAPIIWSATPHRDVAEYYATSPLRRGKSDRMPVLVEIDGRALDIGDIPGAIDDEVLFPAGRKFKVLSTDERTINNDRVLVFKVQQQDAPPTGKGPGGNKVVLRSKQLSPEELDQVASDIDSARDLERASGGSHDPFYDTAALEIRRIRDTAPMVPGVADETTAVKGYDAEGNIDVRRGLSGMKGLQETRSRELEAKLTGAGLPAKLPGGRSESLTSDNPAPVSGDEIQAALARQKDGMQPDHLDYLRAGGQPANPAVDRVRVEVYPDTGVTIGNGRERLTVAREQGKPHVRGDFVRYDAEGNVVEELRDVDIPTGALGKNQDPVPALDPKQREGYRSRLLDYERTPGMDETRYEPLRRFAELAGVRKELDDIPAITAFQHLQGKASAGKAIKGVISEGGPTGYVTSGASDFARIHLDPVSQALGGVPATLSDVGARRELASKLSPGMLRLLRSMRAQASAGSKTALNRPGGLGTQTFGLRGGPAGARAAILTDEDVQNLAALVEANQQQEQTE